LEQGIIDRFVSALGKGGDAKRGQAVFEAQCMACHQVGDRGHVVGPALSSAMSRPDEALLMEILEPSRTITAGFTNYIATLTDGEILTGLLTTESATSITLGQAEGKVQTVLRKDIETMRASRLSLMPGNFYELIGPGDGADLLAFLREAFGQGVPASVVLFDEEPAFADLLTQGGGMATIETGDRYSGQMSLAVTPPQRYSDRILGWAYRIVEEPGEDEYRYLRMAWKSRSGDGVMVELAANGGWPSSGSPVRRYYCGKNTTKWEATCVSEEVAAEWTVMTVDLWKDCGAFTLTGIAPTAMGGTALFDRIELFRSVEELGR
jgi:putative heme-binding domain-containing protein